jgi:hypothetical protein
MQKMEISLREGRHVLDLAGRLVRTAANSGGQGCDFVSRARPVRSFAPLLAGTTNSLLRELAVRSGPNRRSQAGPSFS